jgi:ribosomal protein S18 acetylase RimI-like enzyme
MQLFLLFPDTNSLGTNFITTSTGVIMRQLLRIIFSMIAFLQSTSYLQASFKEEMPPRPVLRVIPVEVQDEVIIHDVGQMMHVSFMDAYKDFSPQDLKIKSPTKDAWLKETFDEETDDFRKQKPDRPIYLVAAFDGLQLIGALFWEPDPKYPDTIHVRQMGLAPNYRHKNIGTQIGMNVLQMVKEKYPKTTAGVANVRKLNKPGQAFVESFGFKRMPETFHDYNPDTYFGYRLELSDIKKR